MTFRAGLVFLVCLMVPTTALAVPSTTTRADTVDDATIWLTTRNELILGDSQSYCSVRIRVTNSDVSFSSGDKVRLWVYEDDVVGDDELWSTTFNVSSAERSAGRVDRTFNCAANFDDDPGDHAELYAEAEVIKDDCGTFCAYDRPETDNIELYERNDDSSENDDTSSVARPLGLGVLNNRVARDQDWYRFELSSPAIVEVRAEHTTGIGRLDIRLFNNASSPISTGTDRSGDTRIYESFLPAGIYKVRVGPRNSSNYNFYDIRLLVEPLATECFPGDTDSRACGLCGSQSRYCNASGRWTPWSSCTGQGVCSPGNIDVDACGFCGTVTSTCTSTCEWSAGACTGSGVCEPGATDSTSCGDGGEQERSCNGSCNWSRYGICTGDECDPGSFSACYNGPEGTAGVGECTSGFQTCTDGFLNACAGAVLPVDEVCDDGLDNDCDGFTDDEDVACAKAGAPLGSECSADLDCEDRLECLNAPDYAPFTDGYCSVVDCDSDSECGDYGACADFQGDFLCLEVCDGDEECRHGYLCENYGDVGVCVPACDSDVDCNDPRYPSCEVATGQCVVAPPVDPVDDPVDPVDPVDDPVDDPADTDDTDDSDVPVSTDDEPDNSDDEPAVPASDSVAGDDDTASDDDLPPAADSAAPIRPTDQERLTDDDSDDEYFTEDDADFDPQLINGGACSATGNRGLGSGLWLFSALGFVVWNTRRRRA